MHHEHGGHLRLVDPIERPDGIHFKQPEAEAPTPTPAIWVVSLPDLQAGITHGTWLEAAQDETSLNAAIQRHLRQSPIGRRNGQRVEDWAIGAQRDFGAFKLSAFDDLAWVSAVARGVVDKGFAFAAWAKHQESADALARFDDAFLGHHANLGVLGRNLARGHLHAPAELGIYAGLDPRRLTQYLLDDGLVWVHRADDGGLWAYRGTGPVTSDPAVVE